jgi:regulator of RNase E activity RraA
MLDRYRGYAVTDISDAVGRLYTMDFGIRPLYEPIPRLVGTALTVRVPPGDNWAVHGALGLARRDDVLVVDWQGYHDASGSGETALQGPIHRGLAGVVIDGSWRDVPDLEAAGLPIFGRGIAPFSPAKSAFGEINVPVSCGGVIVEPGDVVVADREGVCVVPRRHLEEVADALDALARAQAAAPPPPLEGLTKNAAAFFEAVRAAEAEHTALRVE